LAESSHLENTISSPIEFAGVGLHSGAPVRMRLLPAPGGSGVVFRRTDLDNFEIPATGRNVAKVSYATSLMRQGVLISTTEHLLSALLGCGVDNVLVELDNLELPILDGSALPYTLAFGEVGPKSQRRRREYPAFSRTSKSARATSSSAFIPAKATPSPTPSTSPPPSAARDTPSISPPAPTSGRSPRPAPSAGVKTKGSCATWV